MERLKKELKEKNIRGLALDIDQTLSFTLGYWFDYLTKRFGNPENLTAQEMFEKYKYIERVPYWDTDEIVKWLETDSQEDHHQEFFPLIENSNHIVNKINEKIPIVAYISGRDQRTLNGTTKWLKKHNFPEARVILRPDDIPMSNSAKWKAGILDELYPEVIGIVDDHPDFLTVISPDYKGTIYLFGHEANGSHAAKNIIPCKTWDDVQKKVCNFKI